MTFTKDQTEFYQRIERKERRDDVIEYLTPEQTEQLIQDSKTNGEESKILYKERWLEIVRGDLYDQVRTTRMGYDMRNYPVTYGARITNEYFILLDSFTDG